MPKRLGEPIPRFNLQHPKAEKSPVTMRLRYPYQGRTVELKYSFGESIATKYWDFKQHFPKKHPSTSKLIGKLTRLEAFALAVWRETKGQISVQDFRQELNHRFLGFPRPEEEPPYRPTFLEFVEEYVRRQKERRDLSHGAWKILNTWKNLLNEFSQSTGYQLTFEGINQDFRQALIAWCFDTKNHSINYLAKGLTTIAQFMAAAQEAGLTDNEFTQRKGWSLKKVPTPTIAFSEDELQAIFDLDLSEHQPGYNKARQLFLIGAYTGLRHSDFHRIQKGHISTEQGRKVLRIMAMKTRKPVAIPLHPNLEAILEECGYQAPDLSHQRLNKYVKEVARLAGLTQKRAVYTSAGGEVVEMFRPVCELVSAHTGRRSFATNALINGWPTHLVRAITGHASEQQLHNYIDYQLYLASTEAGRFFDKQQGREGGLKAV